MLTNTFLPHFAQDSPIHKLKMNKLRKKGHQSESGWVSPCFTQLVPVSSSFKAPYSFTHGDARSWLNFCNVHDSHQDGFMFSLMPGSNSESRWWFPFAESLLEGLHLKFPFLAGGAAHFFSKNLLLPGHVHKPSPFIPLEKPSGGKILNNIIEGTKMISSHSWGPMEKENHLSILCKNFFCSSARGNNLQGTIRYHIPSQDLSRTLLSRWFSELPVWWGPWIRETWTLVEWEIKPFPQKKIS